MRAHHKLDHYSEQSSEDVWPFIRKLSFLQSLNHEEISILRKLHEQTAAIRKHQDIFNSKEIQAQCFIVNQGWACRYSYLSDGSRQIINYYLPGDIINFYALNLSKMNYYVSSITPMHVSKFKPDILHRLFAVHPRLESLHNLMMGNEETMLVEQVVRIGRRSAYKRTIHLLLELFHRLKVIGQTHDNTYSMPLTQELLADTLGMSIVHMNRTLHKLRDENLIDIQPNKISLLDLIKLKQIAEYQDALSKTKLMTAQNY